VINDTLFITVRGINLYPVIKRIEGRRYGAGAGLVLKRTAQAEHRIDELSILFMTVDIICNEVLKRRFCSDFIGFFQLFST
jgi:hypothetical protein